MFGNIMPKKVSALLFGGYRPGFVMYDPEPLAPVMQPACRRSAKAFRIVGREQEYASANSVSAGNINTPDKSPDVMRRNRSLQMMRDLMPAILIYYHIFNNL
jgi:hypothetical protein